MYQQVRPSILPTVVKNLLIINGLFFLATLVFEKQFGINLSFKLGLYYPASESFRPYQLVTHFFMHGSFMHLLSNMFALWMFGSNIENVWGPKRFLFFYFFTAFGAALLHMAVNFFLLYQISLAGAGISPDQFYAQQIIYGVPVVGASGAVFGVLLAFGMMFPNTELLMLFFPVPIKAKYFVALYGLMELYLGFENMQGDNIAHFAHLGGMLFGFILIKIWNKKNRRTLY